MLNIKKYKTCTRKHSIHRVNLLLIMSFCGVTAVINLQNVIYAHDIILNCYFVLAVGIIPTRLSCPRPVELLHWFSVSTFPWPWRAQPCFHTLQHGGTRDPTRAAPALTSAAVRPLRQLIGRKWAVPPARIQRRLTREPHVTEVGQAERRVRGFI